jgi:hypothetical protein
MPRKTIAHYTEWTPEIAARFLEILAEGHTAAHAARRCRVSRSAAYKHREADEEFARAWKEAEQAGTEVMEEEARRRAVDGTLKPVYQQGVKVGTIREYSDTLMIFLLKGRKPETYRDNATLKHEGKVEIDDTGLGDEQRAQRIAALLDRARQRADDGDSAAPAVPDDGGTG